MAYQPKHPEYGAVYDPLTMSMLPEFEKRMEREGAGFTQVRREALRKGPSAWANLAKTEKALEAKTQREKAGVEAATQAAEGMDELAMRGGLSSGARERLAAGGAAGELAAKQGIERQKELSNLEIGLTDEEKRMQQLGALPGMEAGRVNAWQNIRGQDLGNVLKENESRNRYNMDLYNSQMQAWAAEQQARATEKSGKK